MHIENSSNFDVRDHYSYILGGMHPAALSTFYVLITLHYIKSSGADLKYTVWGWLDYFPGSRTSESYIS